MTTLLSMTVGQDVGNQPSKWHRSIVANDGCIYGIPFDAQRVIRFNPSHNETTLIGESYDDNSKWWGGCLGNDGNVYCTPANSNQILKIRLSRWDVAREHLRLRWLVGNNRASAIDRNEGLTKDEKNRCSCYQHLILNSDDDIFHTIMKFL